MRHKIPSTFWQYTIVHYQLSSAGEIAFNRLRSKSLYHTWSFTAFIVCYIHHAIFFVTCTAPILSASLCFYLIDTCFFSTTRPWTYALLSILSFSTLLSESRTCEIGNIGYQHMFICTGPSSSAHFYIESNANIIVTNAATPNSNSIQ